MKRQYWVLLAFVLLASLLVVGLNRNTQKALSSRPVMKFFHGRVVDQDGNPLQGAELAVQMSPFAANPIYPGVLPARRPENMFSAYSGVTGAFFLTLTAPKQIVEILDVKLAGYTWLIDRAWQVPPQLPHPDDTRWFVLAGPYTEYPIYTPDTNNPAVFVLVENGYDKAITATPSRGGSDRTRDGKVVVNSPHHVVIPSTGPSAPAPSQVDQAIRDYLESKGIPQIHPTPTSQTGK